VTLLSRWIPHQGEQHLRGLGVQLTHRLVPEDQRGLTDQGAGDRHQLLLATGELGGTVRGPVGEPHLVEELLRTAPPRPPIGAGVAERQQDVLHGGEGGQQVELLEDESDPPAPQLGALALAQLAGVDAVEPLSA
jgi:hypothetical protein